MKIKNWLNNSEVDTFRLSRQYMDDNYTLFILYIDIQSNKTVGDFRKVVRQWEQANKKYHPVPFSRIEWEQNSSQDSEYIRPETLKTIKYQIIK